MRGPFSASTPATALRTGESVWVESREERDARYPVLAAFEESSVAMCAVPLFDCLRNVSCWR